MKVWVCQPPISGLNFDGDLSGNDPLPSDCPILGSYTSRPSSVFFFLMMMMMMMMMIMIMIMIIMMIMMMACRDAFCSDMSMLQVCIPQWLKAIQTSPE